MKWLLSGIHLRAEWNKFNGTDILDLLEVCEFYFDIYATAENYKVKTIITYLHDILGVLKFLSHGF
jgi:hypothetical protein